MAAKTYSEKLRDPRWQKKRLEILSRDDFTCQFCQDKETTLNVHHVLYKYGKEPWDYENLYLITLCEKCHAEETESRKEQNQLLIEAFSLAGASYTDVNSFACGLVELVAAKGHAYCRELFEAFPKYLRLETIRDSSKDKDNGKD